MKQIQSVLTDLDLSSAQVAEVLNLAIDMKANPN